MLFEEKIIHLQRIFVFMKNDIVRLKNMIDFLVNEGNIRGLGKGGVQMIRKEDIKLWSEKYQKPVN
ncbi:hypothetical protein [Capnocytophaga gingivalis]|uniref:hypothetical protein n=1 Tax=Capnocytophaga gingivalis TaxID=1017 RepID=UPI0012FF9FB1|nr:hypothetical protein [Capnocytophaga gingivalis]